MITHPGRKRAAVSAIRAKTKAPPTRDDPEYGDLLVSVHKRFDALTRATQAKVFRTDAKGLWDLYLSGLPAHQRQFHNCHCCRSFIEKYGSLVTIDETGKTTPVMWDPAVRGLYAESFYAMHLRVSNARVVSPFVSKEATWGNPQTEGWEHLSVTPFSIWSNRLLSPGQKMAAYMEDFKNVKVALGEFKKAQLDLALYALKAGALSRSEKFVGPVQWLRDLQDRPPSKRGDNLIWRAIADAPEGYCHPRSSIVGSLLEDIAAGKKFDDVKARFEAKLDPLVYQRPQAPPRAGNIANAEKVVETLGIKRSLERRFARLDDVQPLWLPFREAPKKPRAGVFGHLKPKGELPPAPYTLPNQTVTWVKFRDTVLLKGDVWKIEMKVPSHGNFIALTTALYADAPPIIKWDGNGYRNPVAWYVYPTGSPAYQWGLRGETWCHVTAVTDLPNQWGLKPMSFLTEGVVLILDGAADSRNSSAALFPEFLKDDLHSVRATIEAHSNSTKLHEVSQASACGYDIRKGGKAPPCTLRVYSGMGWQEFTIDRWD